jgi:hypothetical protein
MKNLVYVAQVYASLVLFLVAFFVLACNMPRMFISSETIEQSLNGGAK